MTDKNPKVGTDARLFGVSETDHNVTGGLYQVWTPVQVNSTGQFEVSIAAPLEFPADGLGNSTSVKVLNRNLLFNGASWDRERNNTEETVLASAARTATVNSADFTNYNAKGLHVIVNVTAFAAGASIIPFIQGKDPVSGTYYDILEGLPITTTGINIIKVFPGISAVVNSSASDVLPRTWRVRVTHADTKSITYSVAGALVL